jgi:hypothetical protein
MCDFVQSTCRWKLTLNYIYLFIIIQIENFDNSIKTLKTQKISSLKIVVPQFQVTMIYKLNINKLNKFVVLKQTYILSSQHGIFSIKHK